MARKFFARRKPSRKGRSYRKRYTRGGSSRRRGGRMGTAGQKYLFKRTITSTFDLPITTITPSPFFVGQSFVLGSLPSYTEFTNLFDQYKINRIKVTFMQPYQNGSIQMPIAMGAAQSEMPMLRLHTLIDYDDAAAPASLNAMVQYPNYRCDNFTAPNLRKGKVTRFFRPHTAVAMQGSGVFTSYGNRGPQWIDSASPNVTHYALKYALEAYYADGPPASGFFGVKLYVPINVTYYVSCKNVV